MCQSVISWLLGSFQNAVFRACIKESLNIPTSEDAIREIKQVAPQRGWLCGSNDFTRESDVNQTSDLYSLKRCHNMFSQR